MNARTVTIVGSLALHALLAGAAWWYAGAHKQRKAHSVAVMGDRNKKKEEPKKPEDKPKPPPPPKPKPAMKTETVPAPQPVPTPPEPKVAPPPKSSAPPTSAGEFSNSGNSGGGGGAKTGSGTGTGTGAGTGGGGGGAGKPTGPVKPAPPKKVSEEDACTEAPSKPSPINRTTEIEYTQKARAEGIEGRLVLKVIIGSDGAVADVIVVNSVDPSLDAAAIAAVKTWTFKPSLRCGKPMGGGVFMLAQRFELGD